MVNFALIQMDVKYCDTEANKSKAKMMIDEAMKKEPRPDILVLPEDWNSGFSDKMFHEQEKYVEPEEGPSTVFLEELAKEYKVWIVAGSTGTLHKDGKMRNTTFLINREGNVVGDYSKMHLYSDMDEDYKLTHGDKMNVYDTELGKFGFMICYDIRFCELARTYALKGADAVIVTSEFPFPRTNHWRTLLMARAIENQMFIIACNKVGLGPMGTYCGHSIIITPWGDIIAEGGENEEVVCGTVDFSITKEIRNTIHMFRDRRPETYAKDVLVKSNTDK